MQSGVYTVFIRAQKMKAVTPESETDSCKGSEVHRDHDYSMKPEEQLRKFSSELHSELVFLQRFQCEPELIRFYSGFKDYSTLKAFYLALQPTAETIGRWFHKINVSDRGEDAVTAGFNAQHLCLFDQLFMFLCTVRRGFLPMDISEQFLVSQATVRATCVTWCHYLFFMLGTLPIWLSRQAVHELMPLFFRSTFPRTRVVLDLDEIRVQTAVCKGLSPDHKGITTLKSLIGIAPSGVVSLVSNVFKASLSDEDIIRESGILNLLEPGDEVMTHKSLEIEDPLHDIGVNLVVPKFPGPSGRFSSDNRLQDMVHLKIHVERAIRRTKEYHIFADVVPAALSGSINQLWTVCALLTNFQGSLL